MQKLSEILVGHWIIILIINVLAILFIIGYILELKVNKREKRKDNQQNDKIIFDNDSQIINKYEDRIIDNGSKIISDNNYINNKIISTKEEKNVKKDNEKTQEKSLNDDLISTNDINKIDNSTKQQLHNNIEYIINQSNSVFEEFDKIIPERKIIDEQLKEELEKFDIEIEPIKETKKDIDIDTNIELPEIELSTKEEDIWS